MTDKHTLIVQGIFGIIVFLAVSALLSEDKKNIDFKRASYGLGIQFFLAFLILKVDTVKGVFLKLSSAIDSLKCATCEGTKFVFGYLGGGDLPFELKDGFTTFVFGFQALPMIMVVSAISMLLFHWRILPYFVRGISWALERTMNVGGALGLCCAAKVFLGQTDAPLMIRPYIKNLSRSELFTVMTAGMATTAASIMVLYGTILEPVMANPITHILTASIINIPAAIVISRLMIPHIADNTNANLVTPYNFNSSMEAIATGTSEGLNLFLQVLAMLIVVISLVALLNLMLGALPNIAGEPISLQRILGVLMAPIVWLMGIPWSEAQAAGYLLGTKTAVNEVVAFISLTDLPKDAISNHSNVIMIYALCGFANFSSIAMLIGALGNMAPTRKNEIIELGFKALLAATFAGCLSGAIVGILESL